MEIINCVGARSKKYNRQPFFLTDVFLKNIRIGKPNFQSIKNIRRKQKNSSLLKNTVEIHSVRDFLVAVGNFADNLINHAYVIVFALICCSLPFLMNFFISYTSSFSRSLSLEIIPTKELELLNKMMSDFALDQVNEFDENGNILNSDGSTFKTSEISFQQPVTYQNYTVKAGDTVIGIARRFGLSNISTLIAVNNISNVRQLYSGQKIKIPSIDGLIYTVKNGDSLNNIAVKYHIALEDLLDVNDLDSPTLAVGTSLFIPGATLSSDNLRNAMGELFMYPLGKGWRLTSSFGARNDPFTGVKSFHTGLDMAMPQGTPVHASMSGKIATVGYTNIYGNYVIINHGNGYQTLYAHLSKTLVKTGMRVDQNTTIGLVGSTGYSTGPHLHFTVYKNGKLIDPMTVLKK